MKPYDEQHPLRRGVTVVEASAGTGKTYQITNIVLRLIVEKHIPIEKILIVTFTRAATAELKGRVRQRLSEAVDAFRLALDGGLSGEDPSSFGLPMRLALAYLERDRTETEKSETRSALARLETAAAMVDAASISTIHGFCQRMLQANAFESRVDFGSELVGDAPELVDDIVDDLFVELLDLARREPDVGSLIDVRRERLEQTVRAALSNRDAELPTIGSADILDPLRSLRRSWSKHLNDATRLIDEAHARGEFSGRTYSAKRTAKYAADVGRWLGTPRRGELGKQSSFKAAFRYFFRSQLDDKSKVSPGVGAAHPIFEEIERALTYYAEPSEAEGVLYARAAHKARTMYDERKRSAGVQTFDDLLHQLRDALRGSGGAALRRGIRRLYDAALIDEFQDTDGVQWPIFREVFATDPDGDAEEPGFLYLIGDPKQAIYGFRGANVHVYVGARDAAAADRRFTMTTNWRSDEEYIEAMGTLLDEPGVFVEDGISFVPVGHAPEHKRGARVRRPDPAPAPLRIQLLDRRIFDASRAGEPVDSWTDTDPIADVVAGDLVAMLESPTRLREGDAWRPVAPGDCAVLTTSHKEAASVQRALRHAGVPSVVSNTGSVFETDEARDLAIWLAAVAQPSNAMVARAPLATQLFRWSAAEFAATTDAEGDPRWDEWSDALHGWRAAFEESGFMRSFRRMMADQHVAERILALARGERRLTNLLHVAELVHEEQSATFLGPAATHRWLEQRIRSAGDEIDRSSDDPREIRLETDEEAVKISTIHSAKGLSYGFVWIPFLGRSYVLGSRNKQSLIAPSPGDPTKRVLEPRRKTAEWERARQRAELEIQKEALRLAYVALTRARHGATLYWGSIDNSQTSPLAAIFHGRSCHRESKDETALQAAARRLGAGGELHDGDGPSADAIHDDVVALAQHDPNIAVSWCNASGDKRWAGASRAQEAALQARSFTRHGLDYRWGLSSFTSLTRGKGALTIDDDLPVDPERVGADRAEPDEDREDTVELSVDGADGEGGAMDEAEHDALPLADFPGGTGPGSFLHEIYEHVDFPVALAPSEEARDVISDVARARNAHYGFDVDRWLDGLAEGVRMSLLTPLGGPLGALRLADIERSARLDELGFTLPVAGGESWRPRTELAPMPSDAIVEAMLARDSDSPIRRSYLEALRDEGLAGGSLAGFMNGFIDLVFCAPVDGSKRWFIADYKSNRIVSRRERALRLDDFVAASLCGEMEEHHYFVQYHLYLLALHRFLRSRLGNAYRYDRDVGGAYYLFVRGMTGGAPGPDEPSYGVYFDRPPAAVIDALDTAFQPSLRGAEAHR